MINEILIASANRNKCAELSSVGRRFGLKLLTPQEVQRSRALGPVPDVEEDGATFEENALIKARAFQEWSGIAALGDDSGLEVEILNGRPGIFSKRYGGEGLDDRQRYERLVNEIRETESRLGVSDRRAQFYCSLVLCPAYGGTPITADYALKGLILDEPRGDQGFGYDPVVLIDDLGKTLAEVDFEVTCTQGFRARAAEKLFAQIAAG